MLIDDLYDHDLLAAELAESSDPNNPSPDDMHAIVRSTMRIAVVGISRDPVRAARRVPSYLATKGAEIIPVNPNAERILGQTVRHSLAEVTEPVDVVLIFRPGPDEAGEIVRQAMTRPEKPVIWLQEGIRSDEAVAEARAAGFTVVQDLCMYKVHRSLGDTLRRADSRE